jgi:hypothetical protein
VLFCEANVVNLLDTLVFHGDACHALEEAAVDLVDYIIR